MLVVVSFTVIMPANLLWIIFYQVVQPWSPDMQVPTYHVDGQIDDEVYVYGSYIQSKMFRQG